MTGGQPAREPGAYPGLLSALMAAVRPGFRGEGQGFAEEVPAGDGAGPMEQLLAFSGRQP